VEGRKWKRFREEVTNMTSLQTFHGPVSRYRRTHDAEHSMNADQATQIWRISITPRLTSENVVNRKSFDKWISTIPWTTKKFLLLLYR